MAYVFVTGDVKVTTTITVEDSIKQILIWIGFTAEEQRNIIYNDSIDYFSDIIMFTEKDIDNLIAEFSRRTRANGEINFRMLRTKRMIAPLHSVQYFITSQEVLTSLI